jgi:mevalonate kinase
MLPNITYNGQACAKIVLLGEHAAVYGSPAIALPLPQLQANAQLRPRPQTGLGIIAPQIGLITEHSALSIDNPLAAAVWQTSLTLNTPVPDGYDLHIESQIPIASGLGSGAAVSIATVRCLANAAQRTLLPTVTAAIAFQVELLHHGNPSGLDNTVIAYQKPLYFVKDKLSQTFTLPKPLHLVVADTGVSSSTKTVVLAVRQRWQEMPSTYDAIFDAIGELTQQAYSALLQGDYPTLGVLCSANHIYLQQLQVSHPQLDLCVQSAIQAGAFGAKLSGAGLGGNMLAVVAPEKQDAVLAAVKNAGARQAWAITLDYTEP